MINIYRYFTFLGALAVTVFLITGSIYLAVNIKSNYYKDIDSLSLEHTSGLSKESIKNNYDTLIYYINHTNPPTISLPNFTCSKEGLIHFKEVKELFLKDKLLCFLSLYMILCCIFTMKKYGDFSFLLYGIWSCYIIFAFIFILSLIKFQHIFTIFHTILFSNKYWLFSPVKDPIIEILPAEYFFNEFISVISYCLILSSIFLIIYNFMKKTARAAYPYYFNLK